MRVRDDLSPRNHPPLTGDSAIAGSLNEKRGPLRMKEGAVQYEMNGDTGGITHRNSRSPFEMTKNVYFPFACPISATPTLRGFHCISLRERRMKGSSAPAPQSVGQQKTL